MNKTITAASTALLKAACTKNPRIIKMKHLPVIYFVFFASVTLD